MCARSNAHSDAFRCVASACLLYICTYIEYSKRFVLCGALTSPAEGSNKNSLLLLHDFAKRGFNLTKRKIALRTEDTYE